MSWRQAKSLTLTLDKFDPDLQWMTMGPASVSSTCLLLTVAKKSIIVAGFLGTPKSGHAVKLYWYTSLDSSPCETQQYFNVAGDKIQYTNTTKINKTIVTYTCTYNSMVYKMY